MTHDKENRPSPEGGLGSHGGNVWAASRRLGAAPEAVLDLSTNTFAALAARTADLARVASSVCPAAEAWLHYPDPDASLLRAALARREGVEPACILPGNGASEIIWAVLTALRPRRALFLGPLFIQYARACDALGVPWRVFAPAESGPRSCGADGGRTDSGWTGGFAPDADALARAAASDADLIIACSPNNPGTAVVRDPAPLLAAVGRRTLLLDASYRDFLQEAAAPGQAPSVWEGHRYPRLAAVAAPYGARVVLVGSLTKFFCCPGVRLGYAAADAGTVARLAAARPAWSVSTLAERIGLTLLEHESIYRQALPGLRRDVEGLAALLKESGLFRRVLPGVSFATAALDDPADAVPLRAWLLDRHRVLVRVCDNIPGMPPGWVRVQARAETELAPLRAGLREFAARPSGSG